MKFEIKSTRNKENCIYKTLYLKQCLFMQIENCANTSPPPLAAPPLKGRRREGSP